MPDELGTLVAALADLGDRLEYPADPGPAFAAAVASAAAERRRTGSVRRIATTQSSRAHARWRLPSQRPVRRTLILAAAIVLLLAVAAAAATFGVRGVRIIFGPPPATIGPSGLATTPSPAPLGSHLLLGEPLSLAEARSRVSFDIVVPNLPVLGRPIVYVSNAIRGGAVTFVYRASADIPSEGASGVGVLLTEFVGHVHQTYIEKYLQDATGVQRVSVGGRPGVWISGGVHEVAYVDAEGNLIDDSLRISGNALLWQRGPLTLRLETVADLDRALAIAESAR